MELAWTCVCVDRRSNGVVEGVDLDKLEVDEGVVVSYLRWALSVRPFDDILALIKRYRLCRRTHSGLFECLDALKVAVRRGQCTVYHPLVYIPYLFDLFIG